jgi:hypothetical protein
MKQLSLEENKLKTMFQDTRLSERNTKEDKKSEEKAV